jgi:hypothetical protein
MAEKPGHVEDVDARLEAGCRVGMPQAVERARKREGLRVCRAAWLVGVSVREYRKIEAGDRTPSPGTYERISELFGWPPTFVSRPG